MTKQREWIKFEREEKEYKSSKSKVYPQHLLEKTRGSEKRVEYGGRATWGSREPISYSSEEVGYITDRWRR